MWSGIGLVVANTIGVGVLTTTGYMARDMSPNVILVAWVLGALIALAGAFCYATIANRIPRSGGEYRYLSDLVHPSVGYLAGWTSLLVGFSAPVAVAAYSAALFAETLVPSLDARATAIGIIVVVTLLHAVSRRVSLRSQNFLAGTKLIVFVGFLGVALIYGANQWPDWQPPAVVESGSSGFPAGPFFIALVFIAYAFSGWNTSIYAAEEFKNPRRDVARSMIGGTIVIGVLYLAVNWIFVSNLDGAKMAAIAGSETQAVTLAHFVAVDIVGHGAAQLVSVALILMLVSSMSAMTVVGPHVYSTMARDGYLPRFLMRRGDRLPVASVLVQSGLAVAMLMTHSFELLIRNIGAMLTLMSALTVIAVLKTRPRPFILACAGVYVIASGWMLYYAFADSPITLAWGLAAFGLAFAGYLGTNRLTQRGETAPESE
jgi:APA family basic amino acid/polyamine antiporter